MKPLLFVFLMVTAIVLLFVSIAAGPIMWLLYMVGLVILALHFAPKG